MLTSLLEETSSFTLSLFPKIRSSENVASLLTPATAAVMERLKNYTETNKRRTVTEVDFCRKKNLPLNHLILCV